jgi:hypothetical protein
MGGGPDSSWGMYPVYALVGAIVVLLVLLPFACGG